MDPFEGLDDIPDTPTQEKKKKTTRSRAKKRTLDSNVVKELSVVEEKPQQVTVKGHKEKAKLVYAIQSYGKNKRFGQYLREECGHCFDSAYLKHLSVQELKLELEKQEVALANKQNHGLMDTGIKNGMLFAENLLCRTTRCKVHGTTRTLYQDEHYLDLLERVKMKHATPFVKLDPVLELALCVGQTAFICHHQNGALNENVQTSVDLDENVSDNE